jgi:hypothetical protein
MALQVCDQCGTEADCGWTADPFMLELWPEEVTDEDESWWCDDCYGRSCEEI